MAQDRTPENSQDLKEALARLTQVYSSCRTYEDQGVVTEGMPDEGGEEQVSEAALDNQAEFTVGGTTLMLIVTSPR